MTSGSLLLFRIGHLPLSNELYTSQVVSSELSSCWHSLFPLPLPRMCCSFLTSALPFDIHGTYGAYQVPPFTGTSELGSYSLRRWVCRSLHGYAQIQPFLPIFMKFFIAAFILRSRRLQVFTSVMPSLSFPCPCPLRARFQLGFSSCNEQPYCYGCTFGQE